MVSEWDSVYIPLLPCLLKVHEQSYSILGTKIKIQSVHCCRSPGPGLKSTALLCRIQCIVNRLPGQVFLYVWVCWAVGNATELTVIAAAVPLNLPVWIPPSLPSVAQCGHQPGKNHTHKRAASASATGPPSQQHHALHSSPYRGSRLTHLSGEAQRERENISVYESTV